MPDRFLSLKVAARFQHLAEGHKIDLGGASVLVDQGGGVWKVWSDSGELQATFLVAKWPGSDVFALDGAEAFDRGLGLGRKVIQALVDHFGALRSDHQGRTSDAAERAWKSLGALSLHNQDKGFGHSWYVLFRNKDDADKVLAARS
jgi:hypothetical protein